MNPVFFHNTDIRVLSGFFHGLGIKSPENIPEIARYEWCLYLGIEGGISFVIDGKQYSAPQGKILLVPPYTPFKKINTENSLTLNIDFLFTLSYKPETPVFLLLDADERIRERVDYLFQLLRKKTDPNSADSYKPDIELSLLIRFLILKIFLQVDPSFLSADPQEQKLNDLIFSYLMNSSNTFTIKKMAEHFKVSSSEASILIKSITGLSPNLLFTRLRNNKAWNLIKRTNYSFDEIAEILGFSDRFSFSKNFKKYNHISPGQVRRNYQSQKNLDTLIY